MSLFDSKRHSETKTVNDTEDDEMMEMRRINNLFQYKTYHLPFSGNLSLKHTASTLRMWLHCSCSQPRFWMNKTSVNKFTAYNKWTTIYRSRLYLLLPKASAKRSIATRWTVRTQNPWLDPLHIQYNAIFALVNVFWILVIRLFCLRECDHVCIP